MKKYSILLLFLSAYTFGQNTYVDPTTTLALKNYADTIEKGQEETNEQQKKLRQAQMWVGTQMAKANEIQNKILKGLTEVSGTLQNGIQVKEIFRHLDDCRKYSAHIGKLVKTHPQYSIFGVKAAELAGKQIIKIGTDVSDLLRAGDTNMMTAGDRYKLLSGIEQNVKMLKVWLFNIINRIEMAERVGFWKAINPFQSYINTDVQIVKGIMRRYKNNF